MDDAAAAGMRLVVALTWNAFALCDAVNAPLSSMFVTNGACWRELRDYTTTMVTRYRHHDVV
eukprot:CAMPEP_0198353830 /NCGR_PEP_ID=MMETSP1450-20131203/112933_1 /TAXON_ID=753684 ORGANISM="Madagascaria erythrocladiodes, Strain CCMP3234" /NCGR_SAMPLE_ID=MMETSP1450 /ASSEMBLY_ACC=CAM_ASM_001115 /LENGTH=61 /DNA_ID=CAMNT_0044060025 /DNA_START=1 /DNA_END=182 /DNA_ORIENTATION=+